MTYVDDRIALVALAKKADKAWLAGKTGQANQLIVSYNKKDAAVAASAKKLPASPANTVAEAYKALADAPNGAYVQGTKEGGRGGQRAASDVA